MLLRFVVAVVSIWFFVSLIRKRSFRDTMSEKFITLCKNPIFFSLSAYFVVFTLTTFFAVNPYWAFWGSIERGEGVVGMLFFFGFFLFTLLLFQKKDWLSFFKLSMITAIILLIDAMGEAFKGEVRPASFTGHPTYLGAYFIFVMFMASILWQNTRRNERVWEIISIVMIPLSFLGIFITKTRGALIGIMAGFFITLVYLTLFGKDVKWKRFHLRHLSIAFLAFLVLFSGIFIATRQHPLWQAIPGLNRLAVISSKDATTQSRLLTYKVALRAVDPKEGNLDKLLVGWGADNFSIAWNTFYDPRIYMYDPTTLDRAHNKVLDTLVMNGILGLITYLAIWFFSFKVVFGREEIEYRPDLIFFGVSYFVQNLFVFDSVVTYIPFFVFLSFLILLQLTKKA